MLWMVSAVETNPRSRMVVAKSRALMIVVASAASLATYCLTVMPRISAVPKPPSVEATSFMLIDWPPSRAWTNRTGLDERVRKIVRRQDRFDDRQSVRVV